MKILVCGGRDFHNADLMFNALDQFLGKVTTVISGHARGADQIAEAWAKKRGIKLEIYPADWKKHGRAAGPIRNKQMLDDGRPDMVIAFKGGRGTANMLKQASLSGVRILDYRN